ncbi:MAG: hypothetical protein C0399_06775 [Syntrophus sp. (in: bacteria)]|nr:hypothetical protein [Syntrophus sp. (in: bacteria)]
MIKARPPGIEPRTYGLEELTGKAYLQVISITYKFVSAVSAVCRWLIYHHRYLEFPPKPPPKFQRRLFKKELLKKPPGKQSGGMAIPVADDNSQTRFDHEGELCLL